MKVYSQQKAIVMIKKFVKLNGRIPKETEFCSANGLPSTGALLRLFGSQNKAVEMAGFSTRPARGKSEKVYPDEELKDKLRAFCKETKRIPLGEEITKSKMLPSRDTYIRRFGSIENSLRVSGIHFNPCKYKIRLFLILLGKNLFRLSEYFREELN